MSNTLAGAPDRHRLGIITLLGVVSGLPLLLTGSTLLTRMRVEGIEMATIGFFAWVHLPYTFKFLWAPLLDRYRLPFLGRRRGWMLLWQLLLVAGIALLGLVNPSDHINLLFAFALVVAVCAASLDIVVDAYRTEVLEEHERGPGGALYVTGYRAALVLSGAGVLILADYMSWSEAYFLLAGIMLLTVVVTLLAAPAAEVRGSPKTLKEAAWLPLRDLATRDHAVAILIFLLLYKLGESIAGHLIHPFLIDTGFSTSAVGAINKGVGLPAAIAGTLLGGIAVTRLGVRRSLLIFGVLQAAPNLLYAYQYQAGPDHGLLAIVVTVDQFCNGLATAALVVFLMSLCDRRFTAFQYAALSSATSVLGRFVSGWSGVIQEDVGWPWFFAASALATLPALAILLFLPAEIGAPQTISATIDQE
jgi:PAT family beta-lactamase induction signal transducer AmpG